MLEDNQSQKRTTPTRFYLLSGMVICENCGRPYMSQTKKAGRHRRANDAQSYRHRAIEGHCINRTVSARVLEPIVWDEVIGILLDPDRLRKGYYASIEQQQTTIATQKSHLETLQKGLFKLEKERQNLTALYIDPEIKMTKTEYLEQRVRIDDQIKAVVEDIASTEAELASVPVPIEFESLEKFASKVREKLTCGYDPTPEEKRHILELLHIKVHLGLDGSIRLDGWFTDDEEEQTRGCLLDNTSARDGRQPPPPPGRA